MKKYNSWQEKIGFYYNYFGKKRESGINSITTMEIAKEIDKSKANVSNDLTNLIEKPGRRNYGYNTTFIYKELQKIIQLEDPCNIIVVGTMPNFINAELLKNRHFIIRGQIDTFDLEVLQNDIQVLIITTSITEEQFNAIPDTVRGIINLSGIHFETERPYYEIDMLSVITDFWIDIIDVDTIDKK